MITATRMSWSWNEQEEAKIREKALELCHTINATLTVEEASSCLSEVIRHLTELRSDCLIDFD